MVPDSINQAETTAPGDTNLPMLYLSNRNGAPIVLSKASITRRRVLAPTILLCFPQPVRILHTGSRSKFSRISIESKYIKDFIVVQDLWKSGNL